MQEAQVLSLAWKDLWRNKWQPAPVFLPGKLHVQRSQVDYSPWARKRVGHDLATKQQQNHVSSGPFDYWLFLFFNP